VRFSYLPELDFATISPMMEIISSAFQKLLSLL